MSVKFNLIVDTVLLVIFIVLMFPDATGYFFHEGFAVTVGVLFMAHLIAHYDWVKKTMQGFFGNTSFMSKLNLAIDIVLLIIAVVVMVSGIMVSRHILPLFGLFGPSYFVWQPIHAVAAKILTVLTIAHLATHWQWYFSAYKSLREKKARKKTD